MTCKHPNKIWYGVEGWDCMDCPESGDLDYKPRRNNCRAGCKTQDHESYGECLQAANIGIDKTSLKP